MTGPVFKRKLGDRAAAARIAITAAEVEQLHKYFELLSRWSARMNLTALPLESLPDKTIDRLFIEPLAATRYIPKSPITWLDVGSGGGSPAIPVKVLRKHARLTMVESKSRKAAFLREAVRTLELNSTNVLNARLEALCDPGTPSFRADLITVRAVRADDDLFAICRAVLRHDGELLLFQSEDVTNQPVDGFKRMRTVQLTEAPSYLDVLKAI
jgi:16S rRNA (guanine(527)-N(7))-methyltransferase RsmG